MAINLHQKYAKQIQNKFVKESLIAGRLSTEYSWAGAKTVKVTTPITVPMVDYTRTGANRYGEPVEMQDSVQELTLTQDKSFALTIDKGNNSDQGGIKDAGKILSLQIAERAVPLLDTYVFNTLAHKAGNIFGSAEALSASNICDRISSGTVVLDNAEVPADNRTLFVSAEGYKMLKHSDEFLAVNDVAAKALAKGQVGTYDNMAVVKVPASRWPENVNFIIVHKDAATAPVKLNDTKFHQDPPGISGNLLEGRQYYDCFVFGAKCDGVYADVNTADGAATVLSAPAVATSGTITVGDGETCYYTVDGSDPRYSSTALVGTSAVGESGAVVKAFVTKAGCFPSAVASAVLA